MVDRESLAAVLRQTLVFLESPHTDVLWTHYTDAEELRADVRHLLSLVEADGPMSEDELVRLRLLFAPTGALQDTSISSGWGQEFLSLASWFDRSVGD